MKSEEQVCFKSTLPVFVIHYQEYFQNVAESSNFDPLSGIHFLISLVILPVVYLSVTRYPYLLWLLI